MQSTYSLMFWSLKYLLIFFKTLKLQGMPLKKQWNKAIMGET